MQAATFHRKAPEPYALMAVAMDAVIRTGHCVKTHRGFYIILHIGLIKSEFVTALHAQQATCGFDYCCTIWLRTIHARSDVGEMSIVGGGLAAASGSSNAKVGFP